jgi:drug/metabolite transporter (DMT)-like permease
LPDMVFLILSILCSTFIILLFKYFDKYHVRAFRAIIINYWVCVLTGIVLSPSVFNDLGLILHSSWLIPAIALGSVFTFGFYSMHLSVKYNGVTASTIASKNAMVISVTAAYFLYDDQFTIIKIIGIVLAVLAIVFASIKKQDIHAPNHKWAYLFALAVFLISGLIETMLKYLQEFHLQEEIYNSFLIFLFGSAAVCGSLIILIKRVITKQEKQKAVFIKKDLLAGGIMGVFNYASIYFLILALKHGLESSVIFPINNIGVVLLSAGFAFILFRERLSKLNILGIFIAVIAIFMIASNYY